jgi:glucose-1-phosphate cytidylyltransferase
VKVVLFCGGLGMRIRDYSEAVPKPMIKVGYRPILWHLMRYYAHFGHTEFILCLGYRGDVIKDYFLHYQETLSNDFVLHGGGKEIELLQRDIDDWRITFVDTGATSCIGERLRAVEPHLADDEVFLANYSDGVTDLDLRRYVDEVVARGKIASFVCVRPNLSLHAVSVRDGGLVSRLDPIMDTPLRINGGFFVFRRAIFDYIGPGEDLVAEPFHRLIAEEQLFGYHYDGFWAAMDTFKDREHLEELWSRGRAPWAVWHEHH